MTEQTYKDIVEECATTRVDLDTILHPTFGALKTVFHLLFEDYGYTKGDFKRLSDSVYYQGGYPSPTSPAKEYAQAESIGKLLQLHNLIGRKTMIGYLEDFGVSVTFTTDFIPKEFLSAFSPDNDKKFAEACGEAGIEIEDDRVGMLQALVDRAQQLQKEICNTADTISVEAAEIVEAQFKIAKPNFIKAVGLAATRQRRGEGVMLEKIENMNDGMDNLTQALEVLTKK